MAETKIKGWRIENKDKKTVYVDNTNKKDKLFDFEEIRWGLTSNSQGIGCYVLFTRVFNPKRNDIVPEIKVRMWCGNSIGFPHTGGAKGGGSFKTKQEALKFAYDFMRKHPSLKEM